MSTVTITDERIQQAIDNQKAARARVNREDAIRKIREMHEQSKAGR